MMPNRCDVAPRSRTACVSCNRCFLSLLAVPHLESWKHTGLMPQVHLPLLPPSPPRHAHCFLFSPFVTKTPRCSVLSRLITVLHQVKLQGYGNVLRHSVGGASHNWTVKKTKRIYGVSRGFVRYWHNKV